MSSSYDRNIDRLRSAERSNAQTAMSQRTNMAQRMGDRGIKETEKITDELSKFSSTLKDMRDRHIKESVERGRLDAIEQSNINSKKLIELQTELSTLDKVDAEYHKIKNEMIKLSGPDIYPEADRIAHLSPLEQVGFQKEKLRTFKDTIADKLEYTMANSEEVIKIQNMTFTPKQLHDNNIHGLPFKEAAITISLDKIKKAAGLDKFSPELLEIYGVNDAIQKAKEDTTAKYRKRYNIESSSRTRTKAKLEWDTSEKKGENIYHFLIKNGATVDANNKWLNNAGAWKIFDSTLVNEAVALGNLNHIDNILNQEIPPVLAKQLGVQKGTTFAEHWGNKIPTLRSAAKKKIVEARNAEEQFINSEKTALNNKWKTAIRNLPLDKNGEPQLLTGQEIEIAKQQYNAIGEVPPDFIVKYETASLRNERLDKAAIKNLIASQDGAIYHDQLDEFHPLAALEYRDEADKHEAALKKTYNVAGLIESELNETWSDAGIKQNEKKPVWEFALAQANASYNKNFNRLIRMGYPPEQANRLALHAKLGEVKGKDGEPVTDFEGVVAHLNRTGVKNDYTKYGEEANASLKDADIMVSKIAEGKKFMIDNPTAILNDVIGGKYGQNHLNTLKKNMDIYGTWKGIRMSKEALLYYVVLARGKRKLSGFNLIDAQLKADGHPGIWPDRTDTSDNDFTEYSFTKLAPLDYAGSGASYNEILLNQDDMYTYQDGTTSVWNLPENLSPFLDMEFDLPVNNLFGENN